MLPYEVAWLSQGSPLVGDEPLVPGVDCMTGAAAEGYPLKVVLGSSFGDWYDVPFFDVDGAVVTPGLRWAMLAEAEKGSRVWLTKSFAWEVTRDGASMLGELFVKPTPKPDGRTAWGCLAHPDRLYDVLSVPVGSDRAVCVPDGGKIHVMPWLQWGFVATDRWRGAWADADCGRLETMARLRGLGFGEKALADREVPMLLARKLGVDPFAVRGDWAALDAWRDDTKRFQIGIVATRTRKVL